MSSPTRWLSTGFTLLCIAPLTAQRGTPVSRQVVAAGFWAEARYNYAYWDAVRANWDSAFTATVTRASETPGFSDMQLFHALRRWGALLNDGTLEILPPTAIASRVPPPRPPPAARAPQHRTPPLHYRLCDERRDADRAPAAPRRDHHRPGRAGCAVDSRFDPAGDRRRHRREPLGARRQPDARRRAGDGVAASAAVAGRRAARRERDTQRRTLDALAARAAAA